MPNHCDLRGVVFMIEPPPPKRVYLCHKCSGLLQACPELLAAFRCGCISSYIRDWQEATPIGEVYAEQRRECHRALELYGRQGRSATDSNRLRVQRELAAIELAMRVE